MTKMFLGTRSSLPTFSFAFFLFAVMCKAVPISNVSSNSQLRDTEMETTLLEDADQVHLRTARAAVTIPHYLVEQQTTFSAIIQGNHGQTVDGMPMYLHGQPATVKQVLASGSVQFQFDLTSIWEVKDNITRLDLQFMIQYNGKGLDVSVNFCKITQYICTPLTGVVVTPSTEKGYSVVTVSVMSLALSPPDNNILTFTVKTNGDVVQSTVSENVCEPFVIVCSSVIPSRAPSFVSKKHRRSVVGDTATLKGGNTSGSQRLAGVEGHLAVKRHTVTCVLKSHVVNFAQLGITNVASPTSMDIKNCAGECAFENTYSNQGVKHSELLALHAESYVSCRPLTYGAATVLYFNPDASFSLVVETNIRAVSCGCR